MRKKFSIPIVPLERSRILLVQQCQTGTNLIDDKKIEYYRRVLHKGRVEHPQLQVFDFISLYSIVMDFQDVCRVF